MRYLKKVKVLINNMIVNLIRERNYKRTYKKHVHVPDPNLVPKLLRSRTNKK